MSSAMQQLPTRHIEPTSPKPVRIPGNSNIRLWLNSDPAGVTEYAATLNTVVSIHVGASVDVACNRGPFRHRGLAVHGDIDIIPAGLRSRWELSARDTALALILSPVLLAAAAQDLGVDPARIEIRNKFQVRDQALENIGWALKAEVESGYPTGRLYLDGLAVSAAARLVRYHSSVARTPEFRSGRLSDRKLKQVLSYIEDNLSQDLALADLAAETGLSISNLKLQFRESVGLPVHQYVIRRRVERAKELLAESGLSISQIAAEVGFAHQSHLTNQMKRVLGISPRVLRDSLLK